MIFKELGKEELYTEDDIICDECGCYIKGCDDWEEATCCQCCGKYFIPFSEGAEEFCNECLVREIMQDEHTIAEFRKFADIDEDEPIKDFILNNNDYAEEFVRHM